jgi:hypothetical protein
VCPGFTLSYCVYAERKQKEIFIEKEREMYWLGFTTHGCGVCKGVQVHVYGRGATVVV